MNLDKSTVEGGQQRKGDRQVGRESHIDEVLDSDCLGYQSGQPLVGEDYSSYPDFNELAQPQHYGFLRSLLSHKLVKSFEDARKELTNADAGGIPEEFESGLEKAANLFNINAQRLFEEGEEVSEDSKLKQILSYEPAEELKDCKNPLLVSELYLRGLSVEEIAELLEGDTANARDSLKTVGLLNGKTQEEQNTSFEERNGRLSTHGDDSSNNLTVNTKNL